MASVEDGGPCVGEDGRQRWVVLLPRADEPLHARNVFMCVEK